MPGSTWRAVVCAVLLLGTLGASRMRDSEALRPLSRPLAQIPAAINGWTGTDDPPLQADVANDLKATDYLARTYHEGPAALGLFIAYYARQVAGENIHTPKHCLPGNGWDIVDRDQTTIEVNGKQVSINRYAIQNGDMRRVVLYWYQSRRHIVASEYKAKVLLIWDAFHDSDTSESMVRVTVQDSPEQLEAGVRFATAVAADLQSCLGR